MNMEPVPRTLIQYPVMTMLQLAVYMAFGTKTPMGYGHVYLPEHYVDAWLEVKGVTEWDADKIATLKNHVRQKMDEPDIGGYEKRGG